MTFTILNVLVFEVVQQSSQMADHGRKHESQGGRARTVIYVWKVGH